MRDQVVEVSLIRLGPDGAHPEHDVVTIEEPLEIRLNGEWLTTLMRTPGLEKELAAGFCLSEGIIADFAQIKMIRFCGSGMDGLLGRNVVEVMCDACDATAHGSGGPRRGLGLIRATSCGICGTDIIGALRRAIPRGPVSAETDPFTISPQVILDCAERLSVMQSVFRATGATHAACLADPSGTIVAFGEDVGRHNAVDKAAGVAAMTGIDLARHFLVVSGRVSYEIAAKVARLRIPVVASISAPTSMAVDICHEMGVTLVGFVRNRRMNIYCHSFRVPLAGPPS